ncbi:dehydrogenase/reductase SDR family member FEY-like [Mercurialis annua]|uniref:dehydrogenase/reductase SDR family member FEY-like n=1 Tax=Mercurialis annua TaxID=3986 RepID=UPI0021600C19|nr:dehydrogenase/reductase SDR family member FEY-like [Mercurialis annua]
MNSLLVGKMTKRRPWWLESFKGWSYVAYEMLFQKMCTWHLKNPLPLPCLKNINSIVTGCTSGIGLEIAKQLAFSGAHVVMAVRNISSAYELVQNWHDELQEEWYGTSTLSIEVLELNLLSLNSVIHFAKKWNSNSKPLNILVNNAGIFSLGEAQKFSKDGFETHMQVNHFAPALLSILLLPSMISNGSSLRRIINVNSSLHKMGFVNIDDMNFVLNKPRFTSTKAYSNSKLAQVMFSGILQRHLTFQSGVSVVCVSPGSVRTNVTRGLPEIIKLAHNCIPYFPFSPRQGARSALFAATDTKIPQYCKQLKIKEPPFGVYISLKCNLVRPSRKARNLFVANAVWKRTLDMIGLPLDVVERILKGEKVMSCLYKNVSACVHIQNESSSVLIRNESASVHIRNESASVHMLNESVLYQLRMNL